MISFRRIALGLAVAVVASVGLQAAHATPLITNLTFGNDSGDRVTTTTTQTSDNHIQPLYGSNAVTITPLTSGVELTFAPNSGFFAEANNLSGGMTQVLSGNLQFNVTFDSKVSLTTNIYEDGIWGVSGNGQVSAGPGVYGSSGLISAGSFTGSGILVTELDDGNATKSGNSFGTTSNSTFNSSSGTWSIFDQAGSLGNTFQTYHISIDNDLLAVAPTNAAPGYASICKKDFSIVLSFNGSSNGGSPNTPEPASLGILALGSLGLLARRRK